MLSLDFEVIRTSSRPVFGRCPGLRQLGLECLHGNQRGSGGAVHRGWWHRRPGPRGAPAHPGHRAPARGRVPCRARARLAATLRRLRTESAAADWPCGSHRGVRGRPRPRLPRASGVRRGRAPAHRLRSAHQLRSRHARRPPDRWDDVGAGVRLRGHPRRHRSNRGPTAPAPCPSGAALGRIPQVGGHCQRSGRRDPHGGRDRDPRRGAQPCGGGGGGFPRATPRGGRACCQRARCRIGPLRLLGVPPRPCSGNLEDAGAARPRPRRLRRTEPADARGRPDRRHCVRDHTRQPARAGGWQSCAASKRLSSSCSCPACSWC